MPAGAPSRRLSLSYKREMILASREAGFDLTKLASERTTVLESSISNTQLCIKRDTILDLFNELLKRLMDEQAKNRTHSLAQILVSCFWLLRLPVTVMPLPSLGNMFATGDRACAVQLLCPGEDGCPHSVCGGRGCVRDCGKTGACPRMQQYEKLLCHLVIFCVSPLAVFFHG